MLDELVTRAVSLGSEFADAREYRVRRLHITYKDRMANIDLNGTDEGISLRVLMRNNWGFSSGTVDHPPSPEEAISSSFGDEDVNIVFLPPKRDTVEVNPKAPLQFNPQRMIDISEKMYTYAKGLDNSVKSVTISISEEEVTKHYVSSEGRDITLKFPLSSVAVRVYGRENDVSASGSARYASYMDDVTEVFDLNEIVKKAVDRMIGQLRGVSPKPGLHSVVLSPDVVGVFSHEAVGHLAEADLSLDGILHKLKGKKIAHETVNISDIPVINEHFATGFVPYDDEGVEGREVKIIENGVVKEFMLDRFYSAYLGKPPSGNARAEDFRSPLLIRMRNTMMKVGERALEDLLEEVKEGYMAVSPMGGQTDPSGVFQFGMQEGYEVRKGEIGRPLRTFGISGFTIETLGNIIGLSKDFQVWPGFCGKNGQSVPVSTAGPYALVKGIKVGGIA